MKKKIVEMIFSGETEMCDLGMTWLVTQYTRKQVMSMMKEYIIYETFALDISKIYYYKRSCYAICKNTHIFTRKSSGLFSKFANHEHFRKPFLIISHDKQNRQKI